MQCLELLLIELSVEKNQAVTESEELKEMFISNKTRIADLENEQSAARKSEDSLQEMVRNLEKRIQDMTRDHHELMRKLYEFIVLLLT